MEKKKLLVLGGGNASYDVVKVAKEMGIYVIAVDKEEQPGISRRLADENYRISTTDVPTLCTLIKDKKIDGVFCGPSELRIVDAIKISDAAGLRFYSTRAQWDQCSNKSQFKSLCRRFNVPCVPEFRVPTDFTEEDLSLVKYPVIVKPVDGCSSAGLSVCRNEYELRAAIPIAVKASQSGKYLVEKYITSDCGFGCRYIATDGKIVLSAVNDRYTVDLPGGRAMISCMAIFPSKRAEQFIMKYNTQIVEMFKSIGIKNGTMFLQALYDYEDDQIYFHEMGFRLSGGLIYPMLKASCGYSDLEMMIRYAVGGKMATEDEMKKIDPYMNGKCIGSLCIPLRHGTIKRIIGLEDIISDKNVLDCSQYYHVGDSITKAQIGTLGQHFCRFKIMTNSVSEFKTAICQIQERLRIVDENGEDMIYNRFDIKRMLV